MANTLLLKRRIKTAQNVSKTTRAMQMIAASKLKRAQQAALSSRPYTEKLKQLTQEISRYIPDTFSHPYIQPKEINGKSLLIVLSPDKGLCGGLITNLLREYFNFYRDASISLITLGNKIQHAASKSQNNLVASFPFGTSLPKFSAIFPILKIIDEYYTAGKVDSVTILYSRFSSFFSQVPTVTNFLPLTLPQKDSEDKNEKLPDFQLYEPGRAHILPRVLKHYGEMILYQHLLENYVSEQAARMLAMQNATDNAREVISELTLEFNKARQEKITNEILDISSGSAYLYEEQ